MPVPVLLPKATLTMTEGNVVSWRKQAGESVVQDEILFEMETDKVIVEVPAPASGILLRIDVEEGIASMDQPVGWIGCAGEIIPVARDSVGSHDARAVMGIPTAPAKAAHDAAGAPKSSPAARRRARELGIDVLQVRGTGPGGRVTEADVEDAASRR